MQSWARKCEERISTVEQKTEVNKLDAEEIQSDVVVTGTRISRLGGKNGNLQKSEESADRAKAESAGKMAELEASYGSLWLSTISIYRDSR